MAIKVIGTTVIDDSRGMANIASIDATSSSAIASAMNAAAYDTATSSTGYFDLPAGTDAQRPGSPATGMWRYNTTRGEFEVYTGSAWHKIGTTAY